MRSTHQVILADKDGRQVKGTVKNPTIHLSGEAQKLAVRLVMIKEQRAALWAASEELNSELAIASLAPAAADNTTDAAKQNEAQQRLKDAEGAQAILAEKIEALNREELQILVDQLKLIVNVSRGDGSDGLTGVMPEVDWAATDMDTMKEALAFFRDGKLN